MKLNMTGHDNPLGKKRRRRKKKTFTLPVALASPRWKVSRHIFPFSHPFVTTLRHHV